MVDQGGHRVDTTADPESRPQCHIRVGYRLLPRSPTVSNRHRIRCADDPGSELALSPPRSPSLRLLRLYSQPALRTRISASLASPLLFFHSLHVLLTPRVRLRSGPLCIAASPKGLHEVVRCRTLHGRGAVVARSSLRSIAMEATLALVEARDQARSTVPGLHKTRPPARPRASCDVSFAVPMPEDQSSATASRGCRDCG